MRVCSWSGPGEMRTQPTQKTNKHRFSRPFSFTLGPLASLLAIQLLVLHLYLRSFGFAPILQFMFLGTPGFIPHFSFTSCPPALLLELRLYSWLFNFNPDPSALLSAVQPYSLPSTFYSLSSSFTVDPPLFSGFCCLTPGTQALFLAFQL